MVISGIHLLVSSSNFQRAAIAPSSGGGKGGRLDVGRSVPEKGADFGTGSVATAKEGNCQWRPTLAPRSSLCAVRCLSTKMGCSVSLQA